MSGKCDPESRALWMELGLLEAIGHKPRPQRECCRMFKQALTAYQDTVNILDPWGRPLGKVKLQYCAECGRKLTP